MSIKKVLEDNGFIVKYYAKDKYWEVSQYTPAGEDWCYEVRYLKDIVSFAENFDPEDDFKDLFEAKQRGFKGVPNVPELWQDQLWKQKTLNKVLEELK